MKNLLFLMLLISMCGLAACKQKCRESDQIVMNKEQLSELIEAPRLIINYVKDQNDNPIKVNVKLTGRVNTVSAIYPDDRSYFPITDPSILEFTFAQPNPQNLEAVKIQIDKLIDIDKIGLKLYEKNSDNFGTRTISGTVTVGGAAIKGLKIKVNGNEIKSNQDGGYSKGFAGNSTTQIPKTFKIEFFSMNFNILNPPQEVLIGAITVLTDGNVGNTVIDVAFDDDIKGHGR